MNRDMQDRARAALIGAVIADSAAIGLHWIYDTARLAEVGGDSPEFREPDARNYEGVVGVYAHDGRPVGSMSRYGATVYLVAQQLVKSDGEFNAPATAAEFLATFGYGGSFIGYVDHPAAGALDVIRRRDAEIEASFRDLTDRIPFHTIVTIGPIVRSIASDREVGDAAARLKSALDEYPDTSLSDEQMALVLDKVDWLHETYWSPTGVSDLQLPVLAPIIPVALAQNARRLDDESFLQAVRSAAHLTHVDDTALAVGDFVALLIRDVVAGGEVSAAIESRLGVLPQELAAKVEEALGRSWQSTVDAAADLGMSCALDEGLPLSLLTLSRAVSYTDAVRTTILCGGDSCGRGLLVGALAGLRWGIGGSRGVPSEWIETVRSSKTLRKLAERLV